MMANNIFNFKQFSVRQDLAAMKVGTDGVLLGAWASVAGVQSVLDIGTGTGLIALMLAQRTATAQIYGIELDEGAHQQALINFTASPWGKRLNTLHADFKAYTSSSKFDLIVSNPPYFNHSLKSPCDKKSLARHTDSLNYAELIKGVAKLLEDTGRFCAILPAPEKINFQEIAAKYGLKLNKTLFVKPTPSKPPKRVLMEFSFVSFVEEEDELIIEEFGRHQYSEAYKQLNKDFYLAF